MRLEEAIILLINKKAKKIKSNNAGAQSQTLSSIKHWLFTDSDKSKNWSTFFKVTDWEIEK